MRSVNKRKSIRTIGIQASHSFNVEWQPPTRRVLLKIYIHFDPGKGISFRNTNNLPSILSRPSNSSNLSPSLSISIHSFMRNPYSVIHHGRAVSVGVVATDETGDPMVVNSAGFDADTEHVAMRNHDISGPRSRCRRLCRWRQRRNKSLSRPWQSGKGRERLTVNRMNGCG